MVRAGSQTKPGARQVAPFREGSGGSGGCVGCAGSRSGSPLARCCLQSLMFNALPSNTATGPLNYRPRPNSRSLEQEEQVLGYSFGLQLISEASRISRGLGSRGLALGHPPPGENLYQGRLGSTKKTSVHTLRVQVCPALPKFPPQASLRTFPVCSS